MLPLSRVALQRAALRCNNVCCVATWCVAMLRCNVPCCVATWSAALQRGALRCSSALVHAAQLLWLRHADMRLTARLLCLWAHSSSKTRETCGGQHGPNARSAAHTHHASRINASRITHTHAHSSARTHARTHARAHAVHAPARPHVRMHARTHMPMHARGERQTPCRMQTSQHTSCNQTACDVATCRVQHATCIAQIPLPSAWTAAAAPICSVPYLRPPGSHGCRL